MIDSPIATTVRHHKLCLDNGIDIVSKHANDVAVSLTASLEEGISYSSNANYWNDLAQWGHNVAQFSHGADFCSSLIIIITLHHSYTFRIR